MVQFDGFTRQSHDTVFIYISNVRSDIIFHTVLLSAKL